MLYRINRVLILGRPGQQQLRGWAVLNWEIPCVASSLKGTNTAESPPQSLDVADTDQIEALSNVVMITGSKDTCEAATCREYLRKHWGEIGEDALQVVQDTLKADLLISKQGDLIWAIKQAKGGLACI